MDQYQLALHIANTPFQQKLISEIIDRIPMLELLLPILASNTHHSLIHISSHTLTIHHHSLFFCKVLPKIIATPISKHTFLKQMKKLGFRQLKTGGSLQEQSGSNKKVMILGGPPLILNILKEMQNINSERVIQLQTLENNMNLIRKRIQNQVETQDKSKGFEVVETVSSLHEINRQIYFLKKREHQLKQNLRHQTEEKLFLLTESNEDTTFFDISAKQQEKAVKFFSAVELSYP